MEMAGNPEGVVHHLVDGDGCIERCCHASKHPPPEADSEKDGGYIPLNTRAIVLGEPPKERDQDHRYHGYVGPDLSHNLEAQGLGEILVQVVEIDDGNDERDGVEGEGVGSAQFPGPAGVGGQKEVHQPGGEVDGQVHQEMPEEIVKVLHEEHIDALDQPGCLQPERDEPGKAGYDSDNTGDCDSHREHIQDGQVLLASSPPNDEGPPQCVDDSPVGAGDRAGDQHTVEQEPDEHEPYADRRPYHPPEGIPPMKRQRVECGPGSRKPSPEGAEQDKHHPYKKEEEGGPEPAGIQDHPPPDDGGKPRNRS
ncbi:hypothetical protein DSECCO2_448270 [anaerobic digester metagenome]